MSILDQIRQRAAANPQHIVLPEGEDPRTVAAASSIARQRLAQITLLGNEEKVRAAARDAGADLGGVDLIDHVRANDFDKMVALLYEARRAKGMTLDEARTALRDPLYYGNLMVKSGTRGRFSRGRHQHNVAHRAGGFALYRRSSRIQIGVQFLSDGFARPEYRRKWRDDLR